MMIEIKCRFTGRVLFSREADGNTLKATVEAAVEKRADLGDADLRGAYLRGADLGGADLRDAYLRGEKLTQAPLSLLNLRWPILVTEKYLTIGCQCHTHEAWRNFSDEEIAKMSDGALEWWRQWKGALVLLCDAHSGKSGELQGFSAAKGEAA